MSEPTHWIYPIELWKNSMNEKGLKRNCNILA